MSSSTTPTPRRFVIVPAVAAYEAENCWQCPNQRTMGVAYGGSEEICDHADVDMPEIPQEGIPDWCPIKQET